MNQLKRDGQKKWTSIKGKTYLITGANSGLGFSTAMALAKRGGRIHLICRNEEKGKTALVQLKNDSKNEEIFLHICDISLMKDLKSFAYKFMENEKRLDVLINNAGVMLASKNLTSEGIDATFATNTLGTFLLTELLIPLLEKTEGSRVISVSSGGMYTKRLNANYQFNNLPNWNDGVGAYAMTKRHQVILNEIFAKKYTKINFYCMHPGWSDTPGVQNSLPDFRKTFEKKLRSPEEGADTIIWLSISENKELKGQSGLFYFDRKPVNTHLTLGFTKENQNERDDLYNYCRKLCELN